MSFWVRFLSLWLALGIGLRLILLMLYPQGAQEPGLMAFVAGVANDLLAYCLACGVISVFALGGKTAMRAGVFLVVAVALLVFVAEVFFWLEFESRLDRLVFHYLAYPKEVLVFLQDQFYLGLFVLPFVVLCWLLMRLLGRPQVRPRVLMFHGGVGVVALAVLLWAGPFGRSNARIAGEFASNGYFGVLGAAGYAEDDIDWLRDDGATGFDARSAPESTAASQEVRRELEGIRHVVLVIEESFAGPVWEDPKLRAAYLPRFSELSAAGVSFSRVYATGSRTTRGLEALLNGFPPLPGISTTERADFARLPSLARGMEDGGFHPVFLYGGWPGFSNFSNYWQASGFRQIWSRDDFDEAFETSWGVADGALFDRLLSEMTHLSARHERVFLATLTVSHHRPYDFPPGEVDFPADARVREYAMAYADEALGDFFAAAAAQPWFDETLFVVVADHGLHPRGDALIPAGSYRVPLLFYASGLSARELDGMGSTMSLPRTLMSALQIDSDEPFAGGDLLCGCDTVVPVEFGYHIGLLERDSLHVVRADGGYVSWAFDDARNRLGRVLEGADAASMERVIRAFAPAYQWFYAD